MRVITALSYLSANCPAVAEKIKKGNFKVIYSDTDSIAFLRGEKNKEKIFMAHYISTFVSHLF